MPHHQDISIEVADRRKHGYFTIDNVLLDVYGKELGPYGIAVYAALARFANRDEECWPSYATIAERTGVSRSQIIRMLAKLVELKIVAVTPRYNEKGEQTSNLYMLLDIVGDRGSHQTPPPVPTRHPPGSHQEPEQSLKNKYPPKDMNKKNYLPTEYSDIILGYGDVAE